jgi:hypothetical protein
VAVYNFQVADYHTYHVGEIGILVHNANFYKNQDFSEDLPQIEKIGRTRGDAPRSNQAQNAEFDHVATDLNLNNEQRRRLHDEISKMGYGPDEVRQIAIDMFGIVRCEEP